MEITIDEHIAQLKKLKSFHNGSYGASINYALDIMNKYQMMQADYEKRLKADFVAMLTDMQLEFEEQLNCEAYCDECHESCEDIPAIWFLDYIQVKINALKGEGEQWK